MKKTTRSYLGHTVNTIANDKGRLTKKEIGCMVSEVQGYVFP